MSRRGVLKKLLQLTTVAALPRTAFSNIKPIPTMRAIPSTGQLLPVIGMGSHITFNVGNDTEARDQRTEVLRKFFEMGGQLAYYRGQTHE